MFEIKEIRDVIAERQLYLQGQPDVKIRVVLGRPERVRKGSNEHVLCLYQIVGIGDEKVRSAAGVDAVQALQLAMEMVGADLYFKIDRQYAGRLRWEGGKEGDLGFPLAPGLDAEK